MVHHWMNTSIILLLSFLFYALCCIELTPFYRRTSVGSYSNQAHEIWSLKYVRVVLANLMANLIEIFKRVFAACMHRISKYICALVTSMFHYSDLIAACVNL